MSNFFKDQHAQYYNNFINQLNTTFTDLNISLDDSSTMNRCLSFVESLHDEDNFLNFTKSKIKVFSHKNADTKLISESLLTDKYSLKNLLNNQTDNVKVVIWRHLYNIYMITELQKPVDEQNVDRIKVLSGLLSNYTENENNSTKDIPKDFTTNPQVKEKLNEIFDNNLNSDTSEMINDIVKEFESKILNKTEQGAPSFGNIMGISQLISGKYSDKIKSGEIQLEKLMGVVLKKMPGMEKVLDQFGGMENLSKMMNSNFGQGTEEKQKEKVVIDENFSTADIVIPNTNENTTITNNNSMNIGNVLKMADQFGVLGTSKANKNAPSLENLMSGLPNMGNLMKGGMPNIGSLNKMMGLLGKLNTTANNEDASKIKEEMDSFLQKDLGINPAELQKQFEKSAKL